MTGLWRVECLAVIREASRDPKRPRRQVHVVPLQSQSLADAHARTSEQQKEREPARILLASRDEKAIELLPGHRFDFFLAGHLGRNQAKGPTQPSRWVRNQHSVINRG